MNTRLVVLLLVTALVLGLAFTLTRERAAETGVETYVLFPDLRAQINAIAQIKAASGKTATNLKRVDGSWRIAEFDGYPADFGIVKRAVIEAAELKVIEEKTSDPSLYHHLGVDAIDAADSTAVQLTLQDEAGRTLADLIIGNTRSGDHARRAPQRYVRAVENPRALLVEGELDVAGEPRHWLPADLLAISADQVVKLNLRHADGEQLTIVRAQAATDVPAAPDWQLLETPADMELTSPSALLPLVSLFDRLPMESARAASVVDGLQAQHVIAMSTTDGLHILAETFATDATPYVRFTITADPAAPAASEPAAADTTGAQTANSGAISAAAIAATYRARVEGFVFTLPEYKASVFEKRIADLTRAVAMETDRAPETP